jgi:acyl-homoserine lactone acylase PvdQ
MVMKRYYIQGRLAEFLGEKALDLDLYNRQLGVENFVKKNY